MNVKAIIAENEKRKQELYGSYNPITGKGSLLERLPFRFEEDSKTLYLPKPMFTEELVKGIAKHGLSVYGEMTNTHLEDLIAQFVEIRYKYDFEFWTATTIIIQTKDHGEQPFILNRPQRKLLRHMEDMRNAGVPIRIILLKARQWGGSTVVQMYMAWIQQRIRKSWNLGVVAYVKAQAAHIRGMYDRARINYPVDAGGFTFLPYQGMQDIKYVPERDSIIAVGSVQEPEALRSFTFQMLHLSEVGRWPSNDKVNAASLAEALAGAIPLISDSLCVLESTADMVGSFFHKRCQSAKKGEDGYDLVFVGAYEIPDYRIDVTDAPALIKSMTEYEKRLWDSGATLEFIAWYRMKKAESTDHSKFMSEFPNYPDEAFRAAGSRVFPAEYVDKMRRTIKTPASVGRLVGDSPTGPGCLKNLKWVEDPSGPIKVWKFPKELKEIYEDGIIGMRDRFCGYADTGGRTEKSDWNVLKILDRLWLPEGGGAELVAMIRCHMDADLFAWEAAKLATWYDNALLAVEVNKLYSDNFVDEHGLTVLETIKDHYPNLFLRQNPERLDDQFTQVAGFHINKHTKRLIIDAGIAGIRDGSYVERDSLTCDEFDTYENKADGTMGAVSGGNDDTVISTCGGVWLSDEYMPLPVFVRPMARKEKMPKGMVEL